MTFKEIVEAAIKENQERHTLWVIEDIEWEEEPVELENEVVGDTRWELQRSAIFQHGGRYWNVCYSEGATEYQDSNSYDTVVWEVVPYEVTVTKYKRVTSK